MTEQTPTPPDGAPWPEVLAYVATCARSWEGGARLLGNARADDIARACAEATDAHRKAAGSLEFAHQWYAVRHKRLRELAKERGIEEVFAILANGTAASTEPPTYDQILNTKQNRLDLMHEACEGAHGRLLAALAQPDGTLESRRWQIERAAQELADAIAKAP